MLDWITEPVLTLTDGVTIDRMLITVALASLALAWLAARKQRNALLGYAAGLGGFIAARALIDWLLPPTALDAGEAPGTAYTLWSKAAFRADVALAFIAIALVTGVLLLVGRLERYADATARDERDNPYPAATRWQALASAVGSAIWLLVPLILWSWMTLWLLIEADYGDIALPIVGFVLVLAVFAAVAYWAEGLLRTALIAGLSLAIVLAQLRFNATRGPSSMFESNGSVPFFLPLVPALLGVAVGRTLRGELARRQYVLIGWRLGTIAWVTTLVAFGVKYMGVYDFQNSFAFDLASVFKAPIDALKALLSVWYEAVPREVSAEQNALHMARWHDALTVLGGLAAWLAVLITIQWRLPDRREPMTLGGLAERLRAPQLTMRQRRTVLALVLILPAVGLRTFTTFYPFLQTLILSFQKYNPAFPPRDYVGLRNFERLSTDLVVRESLEFTLIFVFVSTAVQMVLGLAIAHLLNANFRLRGLARTISLIPWAVPMVVAAMGFRWMFDDQFGWIPDLLSRFFGYEGTWLINPENARIAVLSVSVWKTTPFAALLLLAGLQGISPDLYEAAKVDGANWLHQLRFVTVPMLMPIIVTTGMFLLVWQLAVFDLPFAMTGGGPGFSTTVAAQKIYLEINSLNYSYAAALSIMLVIVVSVIGGAGLFALRRVEVQG